MLNKEEIVKHLENITDKYIEEIGKIGEEGYNEDLDDICCDINELIEEIEDRISNDDYYRGYNERDKLAKEICKKCKYRKEYKELKIREQKLIEKLEEDIKIFSNYEERKQMRKEQLFENDGKWFYAKEILNIVKGENNE